MKRPLFLAFFLIIAFCVLSITAALFPYPLQTVSAYALGSSEGTLEEIQNGMEITQDFTVSRHSIGISFTATRFDEFTYSGTMDASVYNLADDTLIFSQQLFMLEDSASDQRFLLPVDLHPGSYRLVLQFSDFEDYLSTALYAAEESEALAPCRIDGEESDLAVYLQLGKPQPIVPWLCAVILVLSFLTLLILRAWKPLSLCAVSTVISFLIAGLCYLLPLEKPLLHYPVLLAQAAVFCWFQRKELMARIAWLRSRSRFSILLPLALTAGSLAVGILPAFLIGDGFHVYRWLFFSGIAFVIGFHILKRKVLLKKLPESFLVTALTAGLCLSLFMPIGTELSWDDHVHFSGIAEFTYGPKYYQSISDYEMSNILVPYTYDRTEDHLILEEVDARDFFTIRLSNREGWMPQMLGYLPSVIGVLFGQILGLTFHLRFVLGRVFNLLFYVFAIYLGMKRLKSGQLIAYVIGLLPTAMLMASSYSYDTWLNAMMLLGFCLFVGSMQRPDEPLTTAEAGAMLVACALGSLPKAIYAVVIPIMLFMPKSKFRDEKHHRRFLAAVIIITGIALMCYAVPFVLNGMLSESGDTRGYTDVSEVGQVDIILSDPIGYAVLLLTFLGGYLNPSNSFHYTSFMAYLTSIDLHIPLMTLLIAAMLFDRESWDRSYRSFWIKAAAAVCLFGAVCLAATAMYIKFTPVGYDSIEGCQPRYLLPLLYPAAALIGNLYVPSKNIRSGLAWVTVFGSGICIFLSIWFAVMQYWIA